MKNSKAVGSLVSVVLLPLLLVSVVLLPLLIDSTVWIDIDADLRIILDKIPLTERLSAFGELQYGPETNNRSGKRGALMINKWLSLVGQNYCEF